MRELSWVGLFNAELVGWLENSNRLKELCTDDQGSREWHECREAKLGPKVMVIPVRAGPRDSARRIGEIVLVALPGKGLRAFASSGPASVAFEPDLFDPDWGYGPPWFHQSLLDRRGSWIRVPLPRIGAGWLNADECCASAGFGLDIQTVQAGQIVTIPRGDMFVLGVEQGILRVRTEQPADLRCESADPPPLAPWQEIRIPFEQLRDSNGHLLIRYTYTRGC
jgi:hypothetical protein